MRTTALELLMLGSLMLSAAQGVSAESGRTAPSIVVRGREEITVTTQDIRLSDLAEVGSQSVKDDEAIIALQKLVLGRSPAPGKSATLSAGEVLDQLRGAGVNLNGIGYVFPRVMTVKRAGRTLRESEVRSLIEGWLKNSGRDVALKQINFPRELALPTGELSFEALPLNTTRAGHIDFKVLARGGAEQVASFEASALVDEWADVPVARRTLARGEVVGSADVMMARLNLAKLPRGVAPAFEEIVGLKLGQEVSAGEAFRLEKLAIPPLVEAGSRVTLLYRNGILEATAGGIAMDSGAANQIVRVRNETSKKILSGVVSASGIVEVTP